MRGFPEIGGTNFGGPQTKDSGILASILGSLYFGKLPCLPFRRAISGVGQWSLDDERTLCPCRGPTSGQGTARESRPQKGKKTSRLEEPPLQGIYVRCWLAVNLGFRVEGGLRLRAWGFDISR